MITIGSLSFFPFKNVALFDLWTNPAKRPKQTIHQFSYSSIRFLLWEPIFEKRVTNMCDRHSRRDLMSRVDTSRVVSLLVVPPPVSWDCASSSHTCTPVLNPLISSPVQTRLLSPHCQIASCVIPAAVLQPFRLVFVLFRLCACAVTFKLVTKELPWKRLNRLLSVWMQHWEKHNGQKKAQQAAQHFWSPRQLFCVVTLSRSVQLRPTCHCFVEHSVVEHS